MEAGKVCELMFEYMNVIWMGRSFVGNLLEDLVEFGFGNLAITILIDGADELANFGLGGLPASLHVGKGSIDQGGNLLSVEGVAVILVELGEHGINGLFKLFLSVWHFGCCTYLFIDTPIHGHLNTIPIEYVVGNIFYLFPYLILPILKYRLFLSHYSLICIDQISINIMLLLILIAVEKILASNNYTSHLVNHFINLLSIISWSLELSLFGNLQPDTSALASTCRQVIFMISMDVTIILKSCW